MRPSRLCAVSVVPLLLSAALVAPGTSTAAGAPAGAGGRTAGCPVADDAPKRQMRGDWIASVVNIDWPSRPGLTPAQQQAELEGWYDEAVDRGLNSVVVQVRPTAE